MANYPIVRDEKLICEIDPTAKDPDAEIYLLPEERRRIDAAMTEFREVQHFLGQKVREAIAVGDDPQ